MYADIFRWSFIAITFVLKRGVYNTYFANIGNKVAQSIARKREWKWKHPKSIYTFKFNPIKVDCVLHHLTKLNSGPHLNVLDMDSRLLWLQLLF